MYNKNKAKYFNILFIILLFFSIRNYAQVKTGILQPEINDSSWAAELIFSDDFTELKTCWNTEYEDSLNSCLKVTDGKLEVISALGGSIWLKQKLSGNLVISYDAVVVEKGAKYDRVSDLNCFWMASEPAKEELKKKNGKLSSYDNLNLYYAGIGGNENTTSRFRKYYGDGKKPVIGEYLDKDHLLEGNKIYSIKIIIIDGRILFSINNRIYFDFKDADPYKEGYFAFRTTRSHQQYSNFRVYKITGMNGDK